MPAGGSTTIIGSGVTLTGDITSNADIRIDGHVQGNVVSKSRILIGAEGIVEGNVESQQADILGRVKGNIKTEDILNIRGNAHLTGDIFAGKLQVEPSVTFNGHCYMGANIIEMSKEAHEQPSKKSSK